MRKYLPAACLGLALAGSVGDAPLAQPVGPPNEIWCNRTAVVSSGPATVSLITGVVGRGVSICGWIASATAAATVQIITGTGATCGTGTANVTAAHAIPAGSSLSYASGAAWSSTPLVVAPATPINVCAIVGGTGPVQMTLVYAQF
jgi:hypothetical protein